MIVVFVLAKVVAPSLLLAFSCTKRNYCLCIQSLKQVYDIKCPPYLPIDGISYAIPSKFACATSKPSNKLLFCVPVQLMERWG